MLNPLKPALLTLSMLALSGPASAQVPQSVDKAAESVQRSAAGTVHSAEDRAVPGTFTVKDPGTGDVKTPPAKKARTPPRPRRAR